MSTVALSTEHDSMKVSIYFKSFFSFSHNGHFKLFVLRPHFLHLRVMKLFLGVFIIFKNKTVTAKIPIPMPTQTNTISSLGRASITSLVFVILNELVL